MQLADHISEGKETPWIVDIENRKLLCRKCPFKKIQSKQNEHIMMNHQKKHTEIEKNDKNASEIQDIKPKNGVFSDPDKFKNYIEKSNSRERYKMYKHINFLNRKRENKFLY